jgi:DNA-binding transcriptional ArsR family regulator
LEVLKTPDFVLVSLIYRIFTINYKMGSTKNEEFTVKDNKIAKYAKAMAHPARIAILQLLIKNQACICGDIVDELPLSQSTVSQHLKELKEAGLIKGDIEGVKVCYCIDEKEWEIARTYINTLFSQYTPKNRCC